MILDACLMVHGYWLMAQGSRLMTGGRPGPGGAAGLARDLGDVPLEPGPGSLHPLALSHEPSSMYQASSLEHRASSKCLHDSEKLGVAWLLPAFFTLGQYKVSELVDKSFIFK